MKQKTTRFGWLAVGLLACATLLHAQQMPFSPQAADNRCRQWVDSVMNTLTPQERMGQLLVATVPAKDSKETKKLVKELAKKYKVGGVLFSKGTAEEQAALTNLLQKSSKVPVMVAFDGEWGLAMRLEGTTEFPRNAALGCIRDNALIEAYGREVAEEFRRLGVHVNFAPDADVNTNPLNPVIHVRSFGANPCRVADKVLAYSRGLESGGVLAVAKHFPGHGDVTGDSHFSLPLLNFDRPRLDSLELFPFRRFVEAGHGGVMVGHLNVPALDDTGIPSSLSKPIVNGVLQGEMGFKGLTFTDALDMKGVTLFADPLAKALQAGNDMLLVQHAITASFEALNQAILRGEVSQQLVDEHCRKVLTYKYLLGLRRAQPQMAAAGITARLHTAESEALASRLRKAAVTVLSNCFQVLPLAKGEKVAVLSMGEVDAPFVAALEKKTGVTRIVLARGADKQRREEAAAALAGFSRVIVSVSGDTYLSTAEADFLNSLRLKAPLVYTFFTDYRALQSLVPALQKANAVVLAHSAQADLQQHVADVLYADEAADGRFSMGVGTLFPEGSGCDITKGMKPAASLPDDACMKSYVLQQIDELARQGLEAGAYPGCRILVLKDGKPVYDKGFGVHAPNDSTPVRDTDLFDLSGVTKTASTLLAVMKLYDEGRLKLDDKLSKYLTTLRTTNKRDITIRQLLFHEAGLPSYERFYIDAIDANSVHGPYMQSWVDQWHHTQVSEHSYWCHDFKFKKGLSSPKATATHTLQVADDLWFNKSFRQTIFQKIAKCEVGSRRYVDSDFGFILLQQLVEQITKQPLDAYVSQAVYAPMGLQRTLYQPLKKFAKSEIMPTAYNDFLRRQDLCGHVHDEAAACMGGVAGHAGLFTTAPELAAIYQMLLDGGEYQGKRIFSEATCKLFTTEKSAISRRGLGFDKPDLQNAKQNPCSESAPATVFGHTGFTGVCVWAEPESRTVFVFMSNRLCPQVWNSKLGDLYLTKKMQEAIFQSMK